jgi:outer membrane lipoprotein-sorting protein
LGTMFQTALLAQDATEIIRKADEKLRGKKTAYSEMTITTVRPKWSREMKMKSWSKGSDYSLILITHPAREKGMTFLKREKELWNWVPSIERTIKLPPSMLMQSWMGTDLTNDDLVKESSSVNDYTHKMLSDSTILGRKCWKLELTPKPEAPVVWGKIIVFIDQTDYIQLRSEFYDEDEYLVNLMNASKIQLMGGQKIATKLEMVPVEKKGQKTIMQIDNIVFDQPISEDFFTTRNMKKVK